MTSLPHHVLDGPEDAPPIVLGPSLGTSLAVWEPQLAELARTHRVLRFDLPGHGGTPVSVLPDPTPGRTTVAHLARLVLDVAEHHGWGTFHYAGISLGGAIGAYLAVHHTDRLASLAMICSSARFGDPAGWRERAASVREHGTAAMLQPTPGRWFADPSTAAGPRGTALLGDLAAADRAGYAACCDALAGYDVRSELWSVSARTLVVAGRQDPATPPAHAREIADGVPGAALVEVAGAAHLAGVERPDAVNAALRVHLDAATRGH